MAETIKEISFAKLGQGMGMPHLLDIQTRAFEALLQTDAAAQEREDVRLERGFQDLFPINDVHDVVYVHIDKKKKFRATALLRAFGFGENRDILRLFFAERELDLAKKRESRIDVREVLGAIVAEDITLAGEVTPEDAPKAKT